MKDNDQSKASQKHISQSFLSEISSVQKEVLPSHKLQDQA